ncbi:MAG: type IV secretion system DNA-binding domain-containing protein [Gemmatimonadota bacterium]
MPEAWEPDPADAPSVGELTELRVSLPAGMAVSRDAAEQFLVSLAPLSAPVGVEFIGIQGEVQVQLVAAAVDRDVVRRQLLGHFPDAVIVEAHRYLKDRWEDIYPGEARVTDFGLSHEFMLPIQASAGYQVDPLIGIVGALSGTRAGEVAVLQVLFQPARHPWGESVLRSVNDGSGRPFFVDAPEVLPLAKEKVAEPLFAALLRAGARSPHPGRAGHLVREVAGALRQFARPGANEFIPLSDVDYDPDNHEYDLITRETERSGMILNVRELAALAHLPAASVRSAALARRIRRTKASPAMTDGHALVLGENRHGGAVRTVTLDTDHRLRHTYVVGASGTGKSHLMAHLIIQDMEANRGVGLIDPHGDLVDLVLRYVPENRVEDVIVFDPSDAERPVGFNILEARSTLEKDLLASDMVAVFRRLSTSWGDQMTAVLANGVLAVLETEGGGTIADLRHLLTDDAFRKRLLATVPDREVRYFWEREFPVLGRRSQGPLLTRLNTFLRHRLVRGVVAQREDTLDVGAMMRQGKILLAKIPQGAMGEENAHLLGSLLVARFHQLALARQDERPEDRRPFILYLDEFQNVATPSMAQILAGGRKYGLGLVMAHQDLEQLRDDAKLVGAVLTNPATRIVFRVGERDARKLEEGFSSFGAQDLQELAVGEAICRVERSDWDFNLATLPLPEVDASVAQERRNWVLARSRARHGKPTREVQDSLHYPGETPEQEETGRQEASEALPTTEMPSREPEVEVTPERPRKRLQEVSEQPRLGKGGAQHTYLQELVKRWAGSRGWRVTIEKPILDGLGRVDVALEKDDRTVACEIAVTSSAEQELGNVQKCLAAGFDVIVVVATERKVLARTEAVVKKKLDVNADRVSYLSPEELFAFLEESDARTAGSQGTVRGWRVRTQHTPVGEAEAERRLGAISKVILSATKKMRGD